MITVPKRKLPDPGNPQDSRGQTTLVVPVDPDSVVPDSPYAHLWDDSAEVADPDPGTSGGENIEAKPGEPNAQPSTRTTTGELRDGLTVAANDEIPIASFPSTRGPQVLASFCAAGHPNPPQRVQCYECDAPVSGQPQLVERPQLGWLRITGGETVPLHGPVVAGRNPRSTAFSSPEPPRLIALPHRHISSNHIAFILEGWSVLARDLGSSNGSYLRRHGNPPVRLPENDTLLVPGDVIDLGHGVFINLDRIP
jgi:FHA domain containing protein